MVVYEATTQKQYGNIVQWLARQPSDAFMLTCWGRLADVVKEQAHNLVVLERWKQRFPSLAVFVCENDAGEIRCVLLRTLQQKPEFNIPYPRVKIITAFIDHEDYVKDDVTFFRELTYWAIKRDHKQFGVKEGEAILDAKSYSFVKKIFGEKAEKTTKPFLNPWFGTLWIVQLDFSDVLGAVSDGNF